MADADSDRQEVLMTEVLTAKSEINGDIIVREVPDLEGVPQMFRGLRLLYMGPSPGAASGSATATAHVPCL